MNHVMVDIETLGTTPGSVILSIGAVYFDPYNADVLGSMFYKNISIASSINAGFTVSGETIAWWLNQSKEAQEALFDPKPEALKDVLSQFRQWLGGEGSKELHMWSHGSNFDLTLLDCAYKCFWDKSPWSYRLIRDTRTLFDLSPGYWEVVKKKEIVVSGVKHNALHDALIQCAWVQTAFSLLAGKDSA